MNAPPCCVPSQERLAALKRAHEASRQRPRIASGSPQGMVRLDGGRFLMGTEAECAFPADGEGPVIPVFVSPFLISATAVTNAEFAEFVSRTDYVSEAERFGWSFVFQPPTASREPAISPVATPWWLRVDHADWRHPEGRDSCVAAREDHPVVHVSWNDAIAYCAWSGYRLPTEAEWEFAARGGLGQHTYPWGDELTPGGEHRCNIWQGSFPDCDLGEDGFRGTAPVCTFLPNAFGLFNMAGNVWEWCWDYFGTMRLANALDPAGPLTGSGRVIKGGSFLCHHSYCNRYRNAARSHNDPVSSTANMGFRVVRDVESFIGSQRARSNAVTDLNHKTGEHSKYLRNDVLLGVAATIV